MKALFKLCNDCNRRGIADRIWIVDIMTCRCIFLPVA